jgi:hypothetical protein
MEVPDGWHRYIFYPWREGAINYHWGFMQYILVNANSTYSVCTKHI